MGSIKKKFGHQLQVLAGVISIYTLRHWRVFRSRRHKHIAHPFKLIWVDPHQIRHSAGFFTNKTVRYGGRFSLAYFAGAEVRDGDWDRQKTRFEEHPKYEAVKKRFKQGLDWQDTGIYEYLLDKIEEQGRYDGCANEDDIYERYERIDELYESVRDHGFKSDTGLDHVTVNIGRRGEILFNGNGTHRLAIAKVLNLNKIPVRVLVRHQEWQGLRKSIGSGSMDSLYDYGKTQRNHPDLVRLQS